MHPITRHARRIVALLAILAMVLVAMPLAGTAQDTSSDKDRCKDGGWQTLTRADGTPFASQGECVKYIVSEGGTFGETTEPEPEGPPVTPTRCPPPTQPSPSRSIPRTSGVASGRST